MAHVVKWFGKGVEHVAEGRVDLDTDALKFLLTTSVYVPDQDAHDFRDDVTNEITGTGYTAGGATVTSITGVYDAASNEYRLDFADPSWGPGASITARRGVLYKARGGLASAYELIGYVDFDADQSVTNGTFTIQLDATGFLKITVS